ncbi:DUF72 domain-containing protein [Salinispira pacifica]|uniref:DUF72 domain-containing protein n=1 Tax=Salinispira pacifica TaxID=1307761 RepID=V5WLA5_9SPIO|nr:DUF72 domain-containing protein [Salinispira pacifica]AHC16612.1 hypothetical protein L21SP2_3272 [Salinispira pacifica]
MKAYPQLHIGTSGYSYKDWVGPVYPEGTPQSRYLEEYQQHFSFTEVNSSYYHIPSPDMCSSLVRRSGSGFRFTIKAHQSFTHPGSPGPGTGGDTDQRGSAPNSRGWGISGEFTGNLEKYLHGIAPLANSGKLLGVLAQFPYSFHYTKANRQFLADAIGLFRERASFIMKVPRLLLEFRGAEWNRVSVFRGLEEYKAFPVFSDTPALEKLPGHLTCEKWLNTRSSTSGSNESKSCPGAAVRLHGRNSSNWWQGNNVSRYDYLYSPEEIQEIAGEIQRIAAALPGEDGLLIISFNNHHKGQAVQNARELANTLNLIDPETPGVS